MVVSCGIHLREENTAIFSIRIGGFDERTKFFVDFVAVDAADVGPDDLRNRVRLCCNHAQAVSAITELRNVTVAVLLSDTTQAEPHKDTCLKIACLNSVPECHEIEEKHVREFACLNTKARDPELAQSFSEEFNYKSDCDTALAGCMAWLGLMLSGNIGPANVRQDKIGRRYGAKAAA